MSRWAGPSAWYGGSYDQLSQINIVAARNAGYTGAGVIIGILDTGFKRTHEVFNQTAAPLHAVRVLGEHDYVNNDGNTGPEPGDPAGQFTHGTLILGTLAGTMQLLDAGIGLYERDLGKCAGPLLIATLQFFVMYRLNRSMRITPQTKRG